MSNSINNLQSLPLEIIVDILRGTTENGTNVEEVKKLRQVSSFFRNTINDFILADKWRDLTRLSQDPSFLSQEIENKMVFDCVFGAISRALASTHIPASSSLIQNAAIINEKDPENSEEEFDETYQAADKTDYYLRFARLNETLEQRLEMRIPLTFEPLEQVQKSLVDHSLETIWTKIWPKFLQEEDVVAPATASEIRQWLNNPVNEARIQQITNLNLSGLGLKILPCEIEKFTNLCTLSLNHNQLTELPASIGSLTNLWGLCLSSNRLTKLPSSIGNLTNLHHLSVDRNLLTELPSSIGNLTNLCRLFLNCNLLTELPSSIGHILRMEELYLNSNQLTKLPLSICRLTNLHALYLYSNPLLFILDKDLRDNFEEDNSNENFKLDLSKNLSMLEVYNKIHLCRQYPCQKPLACLCKAILFNTDPDVLTEKFYALPPNLRNDIINQIIPAAASSSSSSYVDFDIAAFIHEKNNHVQFVYAVIATATELLNRLSKEEKDQVYGHVSNLAGRPFDDSNWGEKHAANNIIRLIEAIEFTTQN